MHCKKNTVYSEAKGANKGTLAILRRIECHLATVRGGGVRYTAVVCSCRSNLMRWSKRERERERGRWREIETERERERQREREHPRVTKSESGGLAYIQRAGEMKGEVV